MTAIYAIWRAVVDRKCFTMSTFWWLRCSVCTLRADKRAQVQTRADKCSAHKSEACIACQTKNLQIVCTLHFCL